VEGDDGFLAFVGFEVGQGGFTVHKSIFGQNAGGVDVLQEVKQGLYVGGAVGVVGAEFVAGEVLFGGVV